MVAGNAQGLARAERELGLLSWSVALEENFFSHGADEILWAEGQSPLVTEIKRWGVLWRALRNFDIIHFNFGQSIMPQWRSPHASLYRKYHWLKLQAYGYYARLLELRDLPLLKKAGKGIVVTYQGNDARQGDFCRANFEISPADEIDPGYYSAASDLHKRFRIARFFEYADRIYALNPDLLWVLPHQAQFLPYSHIDLRDWQPVGNGCPDPKVPVVLHAPSHRGVKGTRHVLDAISRLQANGVALEFILVEGLSHAKARRVYERADLLIDQVLCGWYGGLAVEFMALGKPVICYIREDDLDFIPEKMRRDLPIINATPTTIYDVVKEWLTVRKQKLPEVGRRSRTYVENWHDPLKIAARLKGEYEGIMATKQQKVPR
jgi:glycosyltransferase involved in cell wall biosynthesis